MICFANEIKYAFSVYLEECCHVDECDADDIASFLFVQKFYHSIFLGIEERGGKEYTKFLTYVDFNRLRPFDIENPCFCFYTFYHVDDSISINPSPSFYSLEVEEKDKERLLSSIKS